MELKPDISKHCIQTALKMEYEKALKACLKCKGDIPRSLETLMETLRLVLEGVDFPSLRNRFPELSGKPGAEVTVCIENNNMFLKIAGKPDIDVQEFKDPSGSGRRP